MVCWTVGGALAATFVFNRGSFDMPWRHFVLQTGTSMLYSGACAALCVYALPLFVPFARRLRAPADWLSIVAILAAFGLAGSFAAAVVSVAMGLVQPPVPFMAWYPNSMKISIYFTVIMGLSGTAIKELRERLAHTTVALRTKERDEADARRLVAEARLASLESRVDPHFLFNTLNSIAALVRDKPTEAERVVEQLSALMRSSLDRKQPLVSLDEELGVVRSYLEIERVRFGDRLRFDIELPPDAAAGRVPRLALQTLVENSVKYAVSTSRDGACISVHAARTDGRLRISVEDDGPGFDASHLPEGHGLQLLKSRVAMTFHDPAEVRIVSHAGRTAVTLDLPFESVP